MTNEELTRRVHALAAALGGRLRIIGHDTYYVEVDAEHVFIIERAEKFSRVEKRVCASYVALLSDTCQELGRSGKVESWDEAETWIRGAVNAIGGK